MSVRERACVVLFKDSEGAEDYATALAPLQLTPQFVPLLDTALVPADELVPALRSLLPGTSGLIFSSQRAVHAFAAALPRVHELAGAPCFAVGPKTLQALQALGLLVVDVKAPSAEALLPHIVEHVKAAAGGGHRCLFLCGDKRLETLPTGLRDAGIACDDLLVYRTVGRSAAAVEAQARECMSTACVEASAPTMLVFYSPSGVSVVAQTALLETHERPDAAQFYLSIGRTTAASMQAIGIPVHALCPTPDAAGVAAAVATLLGGSGDAAAAAGQAATASDASVHVVR